MAEVKIAKSKTEEVLLLLSQVVQEEERPGVKLAVTASKVLEISTRSWPKMRHRWALIMKMAMAWSVK